MAESIAVSFNIIHVRAWGCAWGPSGALRRDGMSRLRMVEDDKKERQKG